MTTTATTPRTEGRLSRHRSTLLIVLGGLVAVLLVVALDGGARTSAPYDPDNPGPEGARAVARVLADRGVEVSVARGAAELEATEVDQDTTVVVTRPELLGESTVARLLRHTADGALVVVGADPGVTAALGGSRLPSAVRLDEGVIAGCTTWGRDDLGLDGLHLEVDTALAYDDEGCFVTEEGAVLVEQGAATLFGAEQALTNEQVLRADNAAVVLRLLGQRERLVWYVPALEDLVADDGVSLASLLPRWLRPGLLLLGAAAVALVLWRGRRLGPLATEPLPVVVRAIETTRSRGRLYRRAGDRDHAARALRRATGDRLAARLRLGAGATDEAVITAVAARLGRPTAEVAALLDPKAPAPTSDPDLITLAGRLAELDREVRHR